MIPSHSLSTISTAGKCCLGAVGALRVRADIHPSRDFFCQNPRHWHRVISSVRILCFAWCDATRWWPRWACSAGFQCSFHCGIRSTCAKAASSGAAKRIQLISAAHSARGLTLRLLMYANIWIGFGSIFSTSCRFISCSTCSILPEEPLVAQAWRSQGASVSNTPCDEG